MQTDKIIFGQDCYHSMASKVTGLNNNIVVVGSTGSGKTKSLVEPQLLHTHDTSLVVVLSKRELVERYSRMFKKRGYDVLDLNLLNPEESKLGYDPFAYIKSTKDITSLAKALVYANNDNENTSKDPYWENAATSLLSAILALVFQNKSDEPEFMSWSKERGPTFVDVLKLWRRLRFEYNKEGLATSTLDKFFEKELWKDEELWGNESKSNFAVECWKVIKNLAIKTASSIYSCTNVVLDKSFTPEIEQLIALPTNLDFTQLGKKKTVLFVTVSPVETAQQSFLNIFYNDLFNNLFKFAQECPNNELPIPIHIIADDFACCGKVPDFEKRISIFRAQGLSVSLLLQSESQLANIYGDKAAITVINNCDSYVYLGGMDLRTCRNISERLNVPLSDVLSMPLNKVIIFQRGKKPVITERYHILEDAVYKETEADYLAVQIYKEQIMKAKESEEKENE